MRQKPISKQNKQSLCGWNRAPWARNRIAQRVQRWVRYEEDPESRRDDTVLTHKLQPGETTGMDSRSLARTRLWSTPNTPHPTVSGVGECGIGNLIEIPPTN